MIMTILSAFFSLEVSYIVHHEALTALVRSFSTSQAQDTTLAEITTTELLGTMYLVLI